jgi:hypothetical protein
MTGNNGNDYFQNCLHDYLEQISIFYNIIILKL